MKTSSTKPKRTRTWKPRPSFNPTFVYGLDTEDKDGEPTLYGLDSRGGSITYKAGPEARLAILRELTYNDEPKAVFCLNLGYDLVNLFGESLLDVVQPFCAKKQLVGGRLRFAGNVRFYAIERFLPKMSLKELGKAVGTHKLDLPFDDPRRVAQDAKIARVVGERIIREIEKVHVDFKFSPVSGGISSIERESGAKFPQAPELSLRAGKEALYGGRTEVYYCGKWEGKTEGQLFYFDFVSAYGRAMLLDLPDYSTSYRSRTPQEDYYIADVDVEVESVIPGVGPLPLHLKPNSKGDRSLCFPVGTFRGTYTDVDLSLPGVKVLKYHSVTNFPQTGPFLKTITKRLLPKPGCHPISKAIRKNIYTGLSGKFAQGNDFTLFIRGEKARPMDTWKGVPFGSWMMVERKGRPPRTTNYVWSAYIQARNRVWQFQLFMSIYTAGGKLLYGDTDSALAWLPNAITARRIQEGQELVTKKLPLMEAELLSPKVYRMVEKDGTVHLSTKGVPRRLITAATVLSEDIIEGEVPDSFFMLLRANLAGQAFKNKWRKRKWQFRATNRNRQLEGKNNWTKPLTIVNGLVQSKRLKKRGK